MNNNINLPTIEEAMTTDTVYPPEVFGVLLGQLEDAGQSEIAVKVIRRQLENSTKTKTAAQSRINELHGLLALGRRRVIEAETTLKSAQEQLSQNEKENKDLGYQVSHETRRHTELTARLKTFEAS